MSRILAVYDIQTKEERFVLTAMVGEEIWDRAFTRDTMKRMLTHLRENGKLSDEDWPRSEDVDRQDADA